jgi:phospholipase A-2-activating protein
MATSPAAAGYTSPAGDSLLDLALRAAFEPEHASSGTPTSENAAMMALRLAANLFATDPGRAVAAAGAEKVLHAMETVVGEHGAAVGLHNRNVGIALTTAAFNYMVLSYHAAKGAGNKAGDEAKAVDAEVPTLMANVLQTVLREQTDAEVAYRALMALGMALAGGGEVGAAVRVLGVEESVRAAVARAPAGEGRVREVGAECLALLR